MTLDAETQQKLIILQMRYRAASADFCAANQNLLHMATQMMADGDVKGGLKLMEDSVARIEGSTMSLRRILADS